MSELVIVDDEITERRNDVAKLMMEGKTEFAAARQLGLKVVEVKAYWNQWKDLVAQDDEGRDAAKDYLNRMVKHYDLLIEKSHENLRNLAVLDYDEKVSAQVNATLKNIADYEAKRVDALQKSGLLDAHDLGDELAEREQREQMLIGILRNDLCPDCKEIVRDKLSILTGHVEGTVVEQDV